ncbi:hypothetical protein SAMD00019534_095460 [Acytostelium subglobosum LB1]|uniref:hypothetical protein n=1 Tax=Acytostelium subglobosum LB1 TaxID=1410327 RepID=UPI000644FD5B|nr:hypothetical protein SAMD00019534_095460 [Acytostelium subglobosum LB1]GAM26371.1 hypothetical protein SAMD00019534_095460 [Acytostelium subglobosum LB1]|eukprot:XP_012750467.1 hypothetical protein SAMD00019534_095460 [Acytostelium subglobosum LB1]
MQAVWAASRVLIEENNQSYFIQCGGVQMLLNMLNSTNQGLSIRALLALCCLITNDQCQKQLLEAGILSKLMGLLISSSKLLRLHALKIIQNIGNDARFRSLLLAENKITQIADLLSTCSNNDESKSVLDCLVILLKEETILEQFYNCIGAIENILSLFIRNQSTDLLLSTLSVLYIVIEHEPSRLKSRRIIPFLVDLVSQKDTDASVVIQSLHCLTSFSTHASCTSIIQKTNIVFVVSSLLFNSVDDKVKVHCLQLISSLAKIGNTFAISLAQSSIPNTLVQLLTATKEDSIVRQQVITAISWMSSSKQQQPNQEIVERILWALSFFSLDQSCQQQIRSSKMGFQFIVTCLGRDEEITRTLAIKTVLILSGKENRKHLKDAGAIPYLTRLATSNHRPLQLASAKVLSLLLEQ